MTRQYLVKYLSVDPGILQIMQPRVHFLGWHGLLSLQTNAELPLESPSRPSCTSESQHLQALTLLTSQCEQEGYRTKLGSLVRENNVGLPLTLDLSKKNLAEVVQEHRPLEFLAK